VLAQATANVPDHASELWFALGMAYFDSSAYFHAGDRARARSATSKTS
jgi:hypothetical protein